MEGLVVAAAALVGEEGWGQGFGLGETGRAGGYISFGANSLGFFARLAQQLYVSPRASR